jgi:hypothetical protein
VKFLAIFLIPLFSFALEGKVVGVTDGDTIKILTPKRQQIKVRLYGIDAPEKKQPYGAAAKQYLADLVAGKTVQIEEHGKDRYKRVLGVVYFDGKDVNEILVLNGYAWAFTKYSKIYESQERQARSKGLGLWRDKNQIKPEIWRKVYK